MVQVTTCQNEYLAAPHKKGLWVRLTMKDGSTLDGIIPNDLTLLPSKGAIPISIKGNLDALVMREQIATMRVMQVIGGSTSRGRKSPSTP